MNIKNEINLKVVFKLITTVDCEKLYSAEDNYFYHTKMKYLFSIRYYGD